MTRLDNLALACWQCNLKKGPNLTGIDPDSKQVSVLFHPRDDLWAEHFSLSVTSVSGSGVADILGLTPTGRATASLLEFNEDLRRIMRYDLQRLEFGK